MALQGSCADGGAFYICQGSITQFLGCCDTDPCADGTGFCAPADLRATTYDSASYASIPPQACAAHGGAQTPLWYTCAETTPPFLGCCFTNPCQNGGCVGRGNLSAAVLSSSTEEAAPFLTPTSVAATAAAGAAGSPSISKGAVAGIAVGSALAALVLGIVLYKYYKRQQKRRLQAATTVLHQDDHGSRAGAMPSPYQDSTGFPSPPPQYGSPKNFGSDKPAATAAAAADDYYPHSPGQVHYEHGRPASAAPSWLSEQTGTTDHGYGRHHYASVSSLGSGSQGGLHQLYNQGQRPLPQRLNIVSEMEGTPVARPMSELPDPGAGGPGERWGGNASRMTATEEPR